jgi:predicted tellurium resistance membrane protein TerC
MRFVAQIFVSLMERYPFLETCAFVVIGILGIKLLLSIPVHYFPESSISQFLESKVADWMTSAFTIGVFLVPFLIRVLFYHPQKDKDLEI